MQNTSNRHSTHMSTAHKAALTILFVVVIGIVLTVVFFLPHQINDTGNRSVPNTQPSNTADNSVADIEIETPYCTLHYPKEWENEVRAICDQQNNKYVVIFVGKIGNREVNLFSIVFGTSEEMPIGTLRMENGDEVTVHLDLEMLETDEGWSDTEIDLADAMIRASGYTTEILAQQDNFY